MQETYSFYVNNVMREIAEDKPLLRFLRDDLRLVSVKDGCSEGACGTCTILVDGKATKACVLTTAKVAGKSILTVEGLPDDEKEIFVRAFGEAGAVQCGFCTPGMVMAAKGLLDVNPNPSAEDVKKAIRGNLCRCTGYRKIIDAVLLAARLKRSTVTCPQSESQTQEETPGRARVQDRPRHSERTRADVEQAWAESQTVFPVESARPTENTLRQPDFTVGSSAFRIDVRDKVLGTGEYVDDLYMEGMLHASAVRSAHPRARVVRIDASKALALPGVAAVLTAKDVPNNKVGHIQQDWDVMIAEGEITRCVGDAICLVVAESLEILEEAKSLVEIEYEVLEPVRSIAEAMAEGAPRIHEEGNLCQSRHVTRGDAAKALAESKYKVTQTYSTPFTEHAFMEPECALAFPYKDGVKVYTGDQGVYDTRKEISIMLGWEPERIVVENKYIGGGFGGKEDVSVQHLAVLAAIAVNRPVKIKLSRQESINFHPKRHAMEGTFTLGCDENGIFTGLDCEIYFDTGAYASLCGPVLERACTHSVGPYKYQNTDIRGFGYYTNNPPAGAFRGFGVCQSEFALERNIDLLAEQVGISPWEIRFRNAIEPGEVLPNGQIADGSTALKETLLAVKDVFEANPGRAGIACAMKNSGVGVGLPDKGRARLRVEEGKVVLYTAASDIGQGSDTVMMQMLATSTGLPIEHLRMGKGGSETMPDSGTTSGSRHTLITGEAVRMAGEQLRMELEAIVSCQAKPAEDLSETPSATRPEPARHQLADARCVSTGLGHVLDQVFRKDLPQTWPDMIQKALVALEGREFFAEFFEPTDKLGADVPNPKSHVAYAYATTVAIVDDEGQVTDIYAAHDSGKVVNPIAIEGQIEGGVLMSMGYALTEDFPLEDCVPKAKLGTLGLFRADRIPEIHASCVEREEGIPFAYGSKGIGEIASIPAAPAIAGAYYALDGRFRTKLPLEDTYYKKKPTG